MIRKLCLLGVLGLGLVGCANQPNAYYTLTTSAGPVKTSATQASNSTGQPVVLYTLASISVPAPVDDVVLVVRRSDDQLMKLAHDRWTAPLGKQFGNALAVALTNELGMPPLSRSQAAGDSRVTALSVDVQRFDLVPGKYAELTAVWQITAAAQTGDAPKKLICFTQERLAVEPGVAPLVKAQQQNITKLARAIANGWRGGQPSPGTRCQ